MVSRWRANGRASPSLAGLPGSDHHLPHYPPEPTSHNGCPLRNQHNELSSKHLPCALSYPRCLREAEWSVQTPGIYQSHHSYFIIAALRSLAHPRWHRILCWVFIFWPFLPKYCTPNMASLPSQWLVLQSRQISVISPFDPRGHIHVCRGGYLLDYVSYQTLPRRHWRICEAQTQSWLDSKPSTFGFPCHTICLVRLPSGTYVASYSQNGSPGWLSQRHIHG